MTEMSPAEAVYFAAAALPESERAAYLDRACGRDEGLRRLVERMLAVRAEVGDFLESPPQVPDDLAGDVATEGDSVDFRLGPAADPASAGPAETLAAPPRRPGPMDPARGLAAGAVIADRYTLVDLIGEGGMGAVWRARQTAPVKRVVAVKLIKAGMDSRQVLARFDAERQALALMDHTNIARVLDGGVHDGRPYFVMEQVEGVPITEFCDTRRLTPRERLELFVPVCQAIQHAHQKGVIHRDIKPSNVLVALYDDRPVPKVIDFGVAKATVGALTEHTLDTGLGGLVGTPQYMSPEQATFNNLDIDTRTDVYALGVLLYELLTGSPPFSKQELQQHGMLEMLRVVREVEPPRPSTKLSSSEALPSLSTNRATEPRTLTGLLRQELDWVVMKALEKDRSRRYESAAGFAADVQRYLAGEPVLAVPPSASYRLWKFVRRNRVQVTAAALVLAALVAGVVGTSIGLWRANRATAAERQARVEANRLRTQAELAAASEREARQATEVKRLEAERNLAFARKGNLILGSVFSGLNPSADYNSVAELRNALRDNLNGAVRELDGSAIDDPLAVAKMQGTLANSLLGLGATDPAIEVFARQLATNQERLGPDHPETLLASGDLAVAYTKAGKLEQALALTEETLRLRTRTLGADHPDTITAMANLASIQHSVGQSAIALPMMEAASQFWERTRGAEDTNTVNARSNLAAMYLDGGKPDRAVPLIEEVLRSHRARLGVDHPDTLQAMNNLALGYELLGKRDLALPLLEETLRRRTDRLGPDHPSTLATMRELGRGYREAGQLAKALPMMEEALRRTTARQGADHPDTIRAMGHLARGYQDARDLDRALPLLEETFRLRTEHLGADHPQTLEVMGDLAVVYWSKDRLDRSVPLFEELLELQTRVLGRDNTRTRITAGNLGVNYKDAGRLEESIALLEELAAAAKTNPQLGWVSGPLLEAYIQAGRTAQRDALLPRVVADARRSLPADSLQLAAQLVQLGQLLLKGRGHAAAEPLLREALAIRERLSPDDWRTFNTRSLLGGALLGQEQFAEAEPLLLSGYEGLQARESTLPRTGGGDRLIPESLDRLIALATATRRPEEVARWQAERARFPVADPPAKPTP